ncbi:MAG: sigma-70 family RNA polymerase sigma factor [Candidatus Omnitrophota bacterium]
MSFEELHKKLSPVIKRIAWKLNGHYRSFNHDDLYQEASIHLWNNFLKGKLRDKTDSYILQGCYFHLKNYIRKVNERSNFISLDMPIGEEKDQSMLEEILSFKPGLREDCRDFLHIKFLAHAIQNNGFNPRQKRILTFLKEGLTMRDIGKKLGISHVSVVKAMKVIREKAKVHIDPADNK